jgi:pSer/pThr/pTyr-binding forkhead associated (FHA) protein
MRSDLIEDGRQAVITKHTDPTARRRWFPLVPRRIPIPRCLAAVAVLLCLAFLTLSLGYAADDERWDRPFRNPQYLVHIKETNTDRGWDDRDLYILHDRPPDEQGGVATADGCGGWILNKGEPAGGPYHTPRQVCDRVKGIPPELLHLGFDCRQLWALTDCAEICKGLFAHGTWDGESEYPNCDCRCEKGYEYLERDGDYVCVPCEQICRERNEDPHSVYDPAESAMNVCACRCETGYDDRDSEKCEKVDCGGEGKSIADLRATDSLFQCPPHRTLNRHCCCDVGAQPWGGVCQNEVDLPPERRQWGAVTEQFVKLDPLTQTLRTKEYTRTVLSPGTYQPTSYPPGTVVFWGVEGTDSKGNRVVRKGAHSSIVVNSDGDQMEMGAAQVGTFKPGDPPNPPKTQLKNPTYTPYEVWLPPKGTKVKPGVGRLMDMPRGAIPKKTETEIQKWKWNCHGFVKAAAQTYVAVPDPGAALPPKLRHKGAVHVPMKDPPGVPFTLELQRGALYGDGLALDVFLPDGFVEFTDEFMVDVGDDGSAQIYVFEGQANVFDAQDGSMVHVPPDEMVTVREGTASDPRPFQAGSLDRWWGSGGGFEVGGLVVGLGGLAIAGSCLAVLAGGSFVVWQVSRRRRRASDRAPAPPRRPASPSGEAWGTLSVTQGRAPPRELALDRPVLTIGRGAASDLVLLDSLMSRRHLQIRQEDGRAVLHDLASTNGTFVNDARVTGSRVLRSGDVIRVGQTRLVFESETVGPRLSTPRPRRLAEIEGRSSRVSLALDRPALTIGRGSASDLVLVDSQVSRRHAQIRRVQGAAVLYDLGSRNGTFVNGQRVAASRALGPGDVIRVGRTELVFGQEAVRRRSGASGGRLVVSQGRSDPPALDLGASSRVRIGRSRGSNLVIRDDPYASRQHAQIRQTSTGYEILDLGTEAGLFVNGERVDRAALRPGDRIRLGRTEFVLRE